MASRRVAIGVVLSMAMQGGMLTMTRAHAGADEFDEILNCAVLNGISCAHVADARDWSIRVTDWKFGSANHHNNMADAFRHCAWTGALATRIGEQDSYRVEFVHEEYDKDNNDAEFKMYDWNNFTGASIGAAAVRSGTKDQWGYVLNECESRARAYTLYGLNGVKGNY